MHSALYVLFAPVHMIMSLQSNVDCAVGEIASKSINWIEDSFEALTAGSHSDPHVDWQEQPQEGV